jgi:hypothetical protein
MAKSFEDFQLLGGRAKKSDGILKTSCRRTSTSSYDDPAYTVLPDDTQTRYFSSWNIIHSMEGDHHSIAHRSSHKLDGPTSATLSIHHLLPCSTPLLITMAHFNVNQNTTNTSDNAGSNGKKKFPATPHPSKKHRTDGSTKDNSFPALPAASHNYSVSLVVRMDVIYSC